MPSAGPATRAPRLIDLTWERQGGSTGAARHAGRQGHLLRHRRPRHQAGQRHADHEEGHGRRGRGAGARPHGHGEQARRAPARPDPGRREQHRRQCLPPRRRARSAARARRWRSATPTRRGGWCWPTRWRSPTRSSPTRSLSFATLTGAARVALGPELPPFYTDDDALAGADQRGRQSRRRSGLAHAASGRGYEANLDSAGGRHEQRLGGAVRRLGDRRAVPAPLRQAGAPLRAFRHLRLAARAQAARPQGRRGAGRARDVRAVCAQQSRDDRTDPS